MKKEYQSPAAGTIAVECYTALAGSKIKIDKEHTGGTEQWSNQNRGEWGNVWKK